MGKWKIISEEHVYWDGYETIKSSSPYNTGKKHDLWLKEYSICCIEEEAVCDQWWYAYGVAADGGVGTFYAGECGEEILFSYFYIFDLKDKDVVLIAESNGEGSDGYRYKKVE